MPCKCYVNSCQHAENSKFAFWSFLEKFFSPNISHLQFAESRDVKPIDTEVSTVVDSGKPLQVATQTAVTVAEHSFCSQGTTF